MYKGRSFMHSPYFVCDLITMWVYLGRAKARYLYIVFKVQIVQYSPLNNIGKEVLPLPIFLLYNLFISYYLNKFFILLLFTK